MVGTAEKYVGRCVSTAARNSVGWKRPMTVSCPPTIIGIRKLMQIALTWNSGSTSRQWSSPVTLMCSAVIAAIAPTLPWLSITPLGLPVEPLV